MLKIKGGGELDNIEIMSTLTRYIILLTLLFVCFYYLFNSEIKFIIFIILLILTVIGTIFIINDLLNTKQFMEKINKIDSIISITTNSSFFLKFFIGSVGIGIIFKIISLVFFVVVFEYGRKQLNSSNIKTKMSNYNYLNLNRYITMFVLSSLIIMLILTICFITYTSVEIQIIIRNILLTLLSIGTLGMTAYEMFISVNFLRIVKDKGTLYEIASEPKK